MTRFALLAAAALLAGCASPVPPLGGPDVSGWEREVEPSMAPDFAGEGETYPVLLVHQHHLPSKRQREARADVVCLDAEGEEVEPLNRLAPATGEAAATAPCMGPPADAATGRVYLPREDFAARRPDALVLLMDACAGGILFLSGASRELVVRTPAHDFRLVHHANRTFSVDGEWLAPGTALKVSYYVDRGDEMDEEFVRVVFDHPGEWLERRVAAHDPDVDGRIPPRPVEGDGLAVETGLAPASPAEPLRATLAATPGVVRGIEALRMVHDGARLTEVTLRYATDRGVVTWYGAGRTGDALRLLGAQEARGEGAGVPPDAFLGRFDRPWDELRAGLVGDLTDLRLEPTLAWTTLGEARVGLEPAAAAGACAEGCVLVHGKDALRGEAWRVLLAPRKADARDALTLQVVVHGVDGERSAWWHVPPS